MVSIVDPSRTHDNTAFFALLAVERLTFALLPAFELETAKDERIDVPRSSLAYGACQYLNINSLGTSMVKCIGHSEGLSGYRW